jgi:hypothetical protein
MFRFLEMYNESMLIIMQVELALLLEHNLQEISSNAWSASKHKFISFPCLQMEVNFSIHTYLL